MIPREHFPLAITALVLAGIMFVLYREINALKGAVATISAERAPVHDAVPIEFFDEDVPQEAPEEIMADTPPEKTTPKSILKRATSKAASGVSKE
jgi:hypothetical protein